MAEAILRSESPADELPNLLAAYERAWATGFAREAGNRVVEQLELYEDIFPLARKY